MMAGPRQATMGGSVRGIAVTALVAIALAFPQAAAPQAATREYQIKAAFLFNFGQFVSWPPEVCPDTGSPFVIGVLGEDPFGATLDDLVRNQSIQDRPVVVERYDAVDDVGTCQILFVSASETERFEAIFLAIEGRSILTVGDVPGFAEGQGVIGLGVAGTRLRLEINTAAASAANLSISSKLLRLADVVRTERS